MKPILFAILLLAAPAFFFVVAPALADAPVAALAAADPATAVNEFYAVYKDQHAGGGIPDATGRLRYTPVLSPRLNKQLADAAAAQARLTAKVRNAVPPMLEGDIFSSLFEGATAWKIGACQSDAKMARCTVALIYTPPPAPNAKAPKPANWNDTVVVVNTPQGWKVDDVIYDAGFAFGNTGRLSGMLQMVVAANP
jgi:hypothetical protein